MPEPNAKVNALLQNVEVPRVYRVRQRFDESKVEDPAGVLRQQLESEMIRGTVRPGMKVAVTAGSRGIDNMPLMLRETVAFLKRQGAQPFVVPAMGSHGGAVAEGQKEILKSLGITEDTVGCPIRATMEVDVFAHLPDGTPVHIDRYAHQADGIVVINRIKPHTGFRGRYESGIFKMMTVGLGKQKGAETTHGRGRQKMGETIELSGNAFLEKINILFAVACIENAFDKTYRIEVMPRAVIRDREPVCLDEARRLLPRLMLENVDVLVVDRMGKNISGTGMDTNITKSYSYGYGISREGRAKRIAVLDLTEESHGAAVGVGAADMTTRRLFDKICFDTTYPNLLTSGGTDSAKIPMVLDNQKLCIQAAIKTAPGVNRDAVKLIRIRDTLHITEIEISEALLDEVKRQPDMEILEGPYPLPFDKEGNLF